MNSLIVVYNQETGQIIKAVASNNYATISSNIGPQDSFIDVSYDYINDLFNYTVLDGKLVPKEKSLEDQWQNVRKQRDQYLLASDWTQLPDVPISTKESWAQYRQALRDVTLQPDPFNITWPTPP